MASIDLKLIFIATATFVFTYRTEVNQFSDEFAISVAHPFNACRDELYKVVTTPHLLNKWVDWVLFFMPADHKPLKVGKTFKAVLENGVVLFKVTDFDKGCYLAMESNFLFRPRLEISFFEKSSTYPHRTSNESKRYAVSRLYIRLIFRRSSILFQYTIGSLLRKYLEFELRRFLNNLEILLARFSKFSNKSYTDERCSNIKLLFEK